jgi:hypothetical protein
LPDLWAQSLPRVDEYEQGIALANYLTAFRPADRARLLLRLLMRRHRPKPRRRAGMRIWRRRLRDWYRTRLAPVETGIVLAAATVHAAVCLLLSVYVAAIVLFFGVVAGAMFAVAGRAYDIFDFHRRLEDGTLHHESDSVWRWLQLLDLYRGALPLRRALLAQALLTEQSIDRQRFAGFDEERPRLVAAVGRRGTDPTTGTDRAGRDARPRPARSGNLALARTVGACPA